MAQLPEPEWGTFQWVEDNDAFKHWCQPNGSRILWIHGKQGAGSSMLSLHIARLFCEKVDHEPDKTPEVVRFPFDAKDDRHQTTFRMFVSLNYRLLCRRPDLFDHVLLIYNIIHETTAGNAVITLDGLWVLFRSLVGCPNHGETICILDGLDQCDKSRNRFLKDLQLLCQCAGSTLRLVVTSTSESLEHTTAPEGSVYINLDSELGCQEDVKTLLSAMVSRLAQKRRAFTNFGTQIKSSLGGPGATPLTAKLAFMLLNCMQIPSTQFATREALELLNGDVNDLYRRLMDMKPNSDSDWTKRLLSWMIYAIRPLTLSELSVAIAIKPDQDNDQFSSIKELIPSDIALDIQRVFGDLIEIKDESVVFVHYSFQTYLVGKHRGSCKSQCPICVDYHLNIARCCLNYISMVAQEGQDGTEALGEVGTALSEDNKLHAGLLPYAVEYWPVHYDRAQASQDTCETSTEAQKTQKHDFSRFFENANMLEYWAKWYWRCKNPRRETETDPLAAAAYAGCQDLVHALINLKDDKSNQDVGKYQNELISAIENGHDRLAEYLLERGASSPRALHLAAAHDRDKLIPALVKLKYSTTGQDFDGFTPLHVAAERGSLAAVEQLLEMDEPRERINSKSHDKRDTALHLASQFGHTKVMQKLLENDAKPTLTDFEGSNSLHRACYWQQPGAVRVLLESKFKLKLLDAVDNNKLTSLHLASANGRSDIVKLILACYKDSRLTDEILQRQDSKGKTALHMACSSGHQDVVQELLKRGKDQPGAAAVGDEKNSIPLHLAATANHPNVVMQLLRLDIPTQIGWADSEQNNPIHLASEKGHINVVTQLCVQHAENDVSLDFFNKNNLAPIHLACENGHLDIVKLLLRYGAAAEMAGRSGETPLHIASRKGFEDIADLLLHFFANPTARDDDGSTPLHLACEAGHILVIEELLERQVDVDLQDSKGRAPIHLAAQTGHDEIFKMLYEAGADPTLPGESGQTLLQYACKGGNKSLVDLLLPIMEWEAVECTEMGKKQTLMHAAALGGNVDIVKTLVQLDLDPLCVDSEGNMPLDLATDGEVIEELVNLTAERLGPEKRTEIFLSSARQGHERVVSRLLPEVADPNATDVDGKTALHFASADGREEIVKMLLDNDKTTPDISDKMKRTPLSYGAENGHSHIVTRLLRIGRRRVDPNTTDEDGRTPLSYAAANDHEDVLRAILEEAEKPKAVETAENTPRLRYEVDIDKADNENRTPLWHAASGGYAQAAGTLLRKGADPNIADYDLRTPLNTAARNGKTDVVRVILKLGSERLTDANAKDSDGRTAIFMAAFNGHVETFSELLHHEAIKLENSVTASGSHLLHAAYDSLPITRLILQHEKEHEVDKENGIDVRNSYGETALLLATVNGYESVAEELLQNRANPLVPDNNGTTPLHAATERKGVRFFRLMLDCVPNDAGINMEDNEGRTALLHAVANENVEAVKALLERPNVNLSPGDLTGLASLRKAIHAANPGIVRLLLANKSQHEVVKDLSTQGAEELVMQAAESGEKEIFGLILSKIHKEYARNESLFRLVAEKQPQLAEILLKRGVDSQKVDEHGWPLAWIGFAAKPKGVDGKTVDMENLPITKFQWPVSWNREDKGPGLTVVVVDDDDEAPPYLGVRSGDSTAESRRLFQSSVMSPTNHLVQSPLSIVIENLQA